MSARRLIALTLAISAALTASPAEAAVERQVVLVLMPGIPYEEALLDPAISDLAARGGIGLMTTAGDAQTAPQAAVSLSAGSSADGAPVGPVPFEVEAGALRVGTEWYRAAAGEAEPGLLATMLSEAGHEVGYIDLEGAAGDPAMLLAMDIQGQVPHAFVNEFPVLADLPVDFASAEAGRVVEEAAVIVSPDPSVIPYVAERTPAGETLFLLVTAPPSEKMRDRGDTVTPVVLAGSTEGPGPTDGQQIVLAKPSGLTSETTTRDGVVSNIDIAPTVLAFFGIEPADEMAGSPIEAVPAPPTELHARYLEWREVVGPVGLLVLGLAIVALLVGLVLIFGSWQPSRAVIATVAVTGLGSVASLVTLVPASLLPTFSWPVVIAAVAGGGAALIALSLRLSGGSPVGPVALVSLIGLALVGADVAAGWQTGLTPLLGGSALDGERFFGLGNPYAGIVLGGAVLGAARLRPGVGVALIAGAAVFAGLPFLGADVGGCITLAVCAGLWFGLNRWKGFGWKTWALAGAAGALAVVMLVVAHRVLPPGETHVSRTLSDSDGIFGALGVFWERLRMNVDSTAPFAWLAVLGLPVWLLVALRPPTRLRPLFEDQRWRWGIVVLSIGGMLGYVLNDTFGMAGITFVFACAAVIYPALAIRWKGEATRKAPATAPADG